MRNTQMVWEYLYTQTYDEALFRLSKLNSLFVDCSIWRFMKISNIPTISSSNIYLNLLNLLASVKIIIELFSGWFLFASAFTVNVFIAL